MDYTYWLEGATGIACWEWRGNRLERTRLEFLEPAEWIWDGLNQFSYVSFAQFGDAVKTYLFSCHYKPEPAYFLALSVVMPQGPGFDPKVYCNVEIVLLRTWPDLLAYTAYLGAPVGTWQPSDGAWDGQEGKQGRTSK